MKPAFEMRIEFGLHDVMCYVFGSSESERAQPTVPGLDDHIKSVLEVRLFEWTLRDEFQRAGTVRGPQGQRL